MAGEGLLDAQGFFWVPSLAGPTSIAARQAGVGTAWLFPFVDGTPPIGWHDALCYLSFPMLLLVFQVGLLNQHHQTRWGRPTVVRLFSPPPPPPPGGAGPQWSDCFQPAAATAAAPATALLLLLLPSPARGGSTSPQLPQGF